MRLGEGTARQRVLFVGLVAFYVCGLVVALADKLERVGRPDVGWMLDGYNLSPTRWDAAMAGL